MAKRRRIVGVLISDVHHKFFRQCLYSVQKELLRNDINVVTFTTLCREGMNKAYADAECSVYEVMNLKELDGLIVYPTTFYFERQREVLERIRNEFDKPVVCLEHENEYGMPTVAFGRENGMELLVEHLVNTHGVKTIRFVAGRLKPEVPYDRMLQEDFALACEKYGIECDPASYYEGGFWIHTSDEIAEDLASRRHELPGAVICVSDECAAGLIVALEKRGIRVPEDIIVTGYGADDECPGGEYLSVYRDPSEMTNNAVRLLIALMDGRDQLVLNHRNGLCRLVTGGSCGCRRNSGGAYSDLYVRSLRDATESFPSEYNFMSEEITNVTDFRECLQSVDKFTEYLGNYEAFYLCLNENAMHERGEMLHVTDKVELAISHEKDTCAYGDGRLFSREFMFPALYRESDSPRVFYVTPIHFMERVLGYAVISYGSTPKVFSEYLRAWVRKLAHCLETQRRWYMYDDMTVQNQVRDAMTGLYNYKGYINALTESYRHMNGRPVKLRVIALDIERFSTINDAYGREEGNEVLQALSKILQNAMYDRDVCARFGNDEFVIAGLYDTDSDAQGLLNNLRARIQTYNRFNKKAYSIDITYAKACEDVVDEDSIAAITAGVLAEKKTEKENRKLNTGSRESFNEEERKEVIRILDANQLSYHFQPIISAKTGEVYFYEALMRAENSRMNISPEIILKHAESLGRLYDVERLTFFNTLDYYKNHREEMAGRKLFINSIPKVLINDEDYGKLLEGYKEILPSIVIEFTEQTEASLEQVQIIKQRCEEYGMELAIDDYGTGYSNITNLLTYEPDYVKIDRSLISGVDGDTKKQYFVANTVQFAHENGFCALAEGVETRDELNTVIRLGIDYVQGFYIGRPKSLLLQEIDKEIHDDIVRMNLRNIDTRQKKTYIVGIENEVTVIPLVMDGYTELVVPKPDCILIGNPKYQADIVIHIPDNTISRIHLRSLHLESYQRRPCIEIGNRSDVTLVIEGNVSLQDAGIRVPESSSLTIEGPGKLSVSVSADTSYAIGGDCNQSVGKITINMDGDLTIHGDGRECVGIGGGYLRDHGIRIDKCKNLYLTMTGEQIMGIGSYNSAAMITAMNARILSTINSDCGVAIGSVDGECRVDMQQVHLACMASGDTQIGVGCLNGERLTARLSECDLQTEIRAKRCVAVGLRKGTADVRVMNSVTNIRCEGASAVGIGSGERLGRGQFEMSTFNFRLASAAGLSFGYEEETMNFLKCEISGTEAMSS